MPLPSPPALRQGKGWEGGSESLGQARIPAGPPDSGSPELGLPQGLPGLYVRSAQQVGSPSRAGPCLTCLYPQVGPHLQLVKWWSSQALGQTLPDKAQLHFGLPCDPGQVT